METYHKERENIQEEERRKTDLYHTLFRLSMPLLVLDEISPCLHPPSTISSIWSLFTTCTVTFCQFCLTLAHALTTALRYFPWIGNLYIWHIFDWGQT